MGRDNLFVAAYEMSVVAQVLAGGNCPKAYALLIGHGLLDNHVLRVVGRSRIDGEMSLLS